MLEYIDNEMLSRIFDSVLILSVAGLWLLWWRQAGQRKKIEQMLTEASSELQESTLMLNQALLQIKELQTQEVSKNTVSSNSKKASSHAEKEKFKQKVKKQVTHKDAVEVKLESQPTANISQVAKMLRLQREGMEPKHIARELDMPLAQIKLMLMLQSVPNN